MVQSVITLKLHTPSSQIANNSDDVLDLPSNHSAILRNQLGYLGDAKHGAIGIEHQRKLFIAYQRKTENVTIESLCPLGLRRRDESNQRARSQHAGRVWRKPNLVGLPARAPLSFLLQSNSVSMTYVAFLRGVNVGGKSIVSMAAIKEALVALGLSDVRTYINSGNVIFSNRASDAQLLTARIEKALEQHTGMAIKVLVIDHRTLKKMVDAIPRNWVDDKTMRTYVLLLWKELDDRSILDRLPIKPGVDELRYTPGAVVWRVDRDDVGRSQMNRIVGTPLYKKITIRSANTMRKLNELTATPTRAPAAD